MSDYASFLAAKVDFTRIYGLVGHRDKPRGHSQRARAKSPQARAVVGGELRGRRAS